MTKSAQINNKSDTEHVGLKRETENDIRIYERAQSDKGLFVLKSMNYDVCRQFNPQNTINNMTTVQIQLTESTTLNLIRNLTGNDLAGKNPYLTLTSKSTAHVSLSNIGLRGIEYKLSPFFFVAPCILLDENKRFLKHKLFPSSRRKMEASRFFRHFGSYLNVFS